MISACIADPFAEGLRIRSIGRRCIHHTREGASGRLHRGRNHRSVASFGLSIRHRGAIEPCSGALPDPVDGGRLAHLRGGIFRRRRGRHLLEIVHHVFEPIPAARNHAPVRPLEVRRAVLIPPDIEAALVHQPMVVRAAQRGICQARLSAVRPMADVMSVDVALFWQPGNVQPRSRDQSARLSAIGTVRRLRPTSSGVPRSSSTIVIRLPSHVRRLTVSIGRSDLPPPR